VEVDQDSLIYSRRGPNQELNVLRDGIRNTPIFGWYKVTRLNGVAVDVGTYIREDTLRDLGHEDDIARPIRSMVYGLDNVDKANVHKAYELGYRDFDAAYTYHAGKTPGLFEDLKIDGGPVRLVYKFKYENRKAAEAEMIALSKMQGIILHTIMLHEIPAEKNARTLAFFWLSEYSEQFGAQAGLSNVVQEDIDSPDNLSNLLKQADKDHKLKISLIQNRVSPLAPDANVRALAQQQGIGYMGFGVKGGLPGGHQGTCSMGADTAVESYPIEEDALLNEVIVSWFGLRKEDIRFILIDWARKKGIAVISTSRTEEGMTKMIHASYYNEIVDFIDEFADGSKYYPYRSQEAPLYLPFARFMELADLDPGCTSLVLQELPVSLWRLFYKHVLAREGMQNDFIKVMKPMTQREHVQPLLDFIRYEKIVSVTDLSNVLLQFKLGLRAGHRENVVSIFQPTMTNHELIGILGTVYQKKTILLCDTEYSALSSVGDLQEVAENQELLVMTGVDIVARYKKGSDKSWTKVG
jgi:diketogulonate reductase-like aldo/keto reductase